MSPAWEQVGPVLGLSGLLALGLAAWLAWKAGHRGTPFLLLLPMALLALSFRPGGLLSSPWMAPPQNAGLLVAVLALVALFLVQTHQQGVTGNMPQAGRRLVRTALILATLAVGAGFILTGLAFIHSRDAHQRHVAAKAQSLAHSLEANLTDGTDRQVVLNGFREHWQKANLPYPEASFFILGPRGTVEAQSPNLNLAGADLPASPLKTDLPRVDTVGRLIERRSEWVGPFLNPNGEEVIASFSYNPTLRGLVVIQFPMRAVRAELVESLRPWLVALAVILVLLPVSVALVVRAFVNTFQAAARAEEARELAEGRLHSVIHNLPVMIGVLERDGRFSLQEGKALEDLALSPEQAVGQTPTELFGPDPDREEDYVRAFSGVALSTLRQIRDRVFQVWYEPLRDHQGRVERVLALGIDITQRVRSEEEQIASLTKFHSLFENSMDAMFLYDQETRIVDLNPAGCRLLGRPRQEVLGRTFRELVEYQAADRDAVFRTLLQDGAAEGEMCFLRQDGSAPTVEFRARANILPGLHFSIMRDVTERRTLEERFNRARRLESLGVLAGGVAHDFNNLLMTILGSAELALERLDPEHPVTLELERISATGRRASELTQQLMTCSGQNPRQTRPMRLDELAIETVHLMVPVIPAHVEVIQDHHPDQPYIQADPLQLRQVLLNLITNAVEAVGENPGEVRIHTARYDISSRAPEGFEFTEGLLEGAGALLTVRDTGKGMTQELRQRIFDPFFSTKFAGRGLGLAATLGVIRGHGGAVRVDSTPGQGTTFQILFPALPEPAAPPTVTPSAAVAPTRSARPLILVADDEESLLRLLEEALGRRGFEVVTAMDGRRALEIFQETPRLQAVVLDVKMPGMSGMEACRAMHDLRPEVPILLSTGFSEMETDREAAELGAFAVLHKPFRVGALTERLSAALGRTV